MTKREVRPSRVTAGRTVTIWLTARPPVQTMAARARTPHAVRVVLTLCQPIVVHIDT